MLSRKLLVSKVRRADPNWSKASGTSPLALIGQMSIHWLKTKPPIFFRKGRLEEPALDKCPISHIATTGEFQGNF
jgi:hypothetical protein